MAGENVEHAGTSFNEGRRWYVVNTYSGHENKVKENLEKRVESMGLQDVLFNIVVPETVETVVETKKQKDGTEITKKVNKVKNLWPGYVLVEMIMTDEAWYIVRNTSGVTGFIGSSGGGKKPFPVAEEEIEPILKMMGISTGVKIDFKVGDRVKIVSGPWVDKTGRVQNIDEEKEIATLVLDQMSATMEIDLLQLEKVD